MGVGLAALFAVFLQMLPAGKVLAAGGPINGEGEWRQATYTMNQKSTIIVNLAGNDHDNINFNSTSKSGVYKADTNNTGVCDGQITFNSGQTLNNHPIKASISVNYMNSAAGTPTCTAGAHNGANDSYGNGITIINNTSDSGQKAADTGPAAITYKGKTYRQVNTGAGVIAYGANSSIGTSCYGGSLIILQKIDSAANAPVLGVLLATSLANAGTELSKQVPNFPSIPVSVASLGKCYYSGNGNNDVVKVDSKGNAAFLCISDGGYTCKPASQAANTDQDAAATCESNFDSPFAWLICPVLHLGDGAAGLFNSFLEDQLCFKTTDESISSTGSSVVCNGNNNLDPGVHNAWNIFKNLASELIVIALLIMIISQAIGGGPFDAYTIRKMLPKLVAAVILMQLSWVFLKWAIDLSNDVGAAIGNLMLAPFGGSDNVTLSKMLGHGIHVATGGDVGADAFTVFTTIAGIAGFVYAIPALPLLMLYVVLGLFIAFVTLVVRKILIILLVILAPLAFVVWVMPGMDKYWKMWKDNFTKILMMFPLIMAMLAAGRIAAYIAAGSPNGIMFTPTFGIAHLGPLPIPYIASVSNFADLAIIIGAFFAPYFLLPQAFKWGGQLMGAASNAVSKLSNKAAEAPKNFLKEREKGYREERKRKSAERYADYRKQGAGMEGFRKAYKGGKIFAAPLDFFRAGSADPTLGLHNSRRRGRQIAQFAAAGEEVSSQEAQNFSKLIDAEIRGMTKKDSDNHLKERFDKATNGAERFAILQKLAQFKSAPLLETIRDEMIAKGNVGEWNALTAGLYDNLKAISPNLAGAVDTSIPIADQERANFNVSDEVLAAMTAHGWKKRVQLYGQAQAQAEYLRISQNSDLRGRLDPSAHLEVGLGTRPGTTSATTPSAVRTTQAQEQARALPDPVTLVPGTPAREAFKLQLKTDGGAVATIARSIAYGVAPTEYVQVIEDLRNEAMAAGTPEARNEYNSIISQVQQAYQQRIDETVNAASTRGHDPAAVRSSAAGRLAPEIVGLEATAPAPPLGTPDLRKLL